MLEHVFTVIIAYLIDRRFGEFAFARHPVELIGDIVKFYERILYRDSVAYGALFVAAVLATVGGFVAIFESYIQLLPVYMRIPLVAIFASVFIAHHMLRNEVEAVARAESLEQKREALASLVSRDRQQLQESEIYKAAIESYAENLNDAVVAPIFYFILFGLPGIIIYKTINTLDSMVGYKNERYERFGKVAARLDDIAGYIPSRITAILILWRAKYSPLVAFLEDGKRHQSPNAGMPIAAMALALGIKLGGDTSYFGKMQKKACFGNGREEITKEDLFRALALL